MAVDKLVDSAQLDSDLEDVADAIRAKSGGSSPLAFPAGFVSEIGSIQTGGGVPTPNIADFLSLVPAFDNTWVTARFSLLSYPASGQLALPNPLGEIPDYMFIIKTDISLSSDLNGIIGGYNFIGGAATDNALNRNIQYIENTNAGSNYDLLTNYGMFGAITNNNWSCVVAASAAWTTETLSFRCGTGKNQTNGYCLGNYLLAVKKVSV